VIFAGLAAAAVILLAGMVPARLVAWAGAVGLAALLLGPAAYTLNTVDTAHTGAIPSAGPASATGFGGAPGGGRGGFGGGGPQSQGSTSQGSMSQGNAFRGGVPGGGPQGGTSHGNSAQGGFGGGAMTGGGGMGGLLNGSSVGSALAQLLEKNAGQYTWVAATIGSNNAAGYQLATGAPVMAIGGFNGTDPTPALARFEQYAKEGKIHYYVSGSTGGSSSSASQIEAWVKAHYPAQTVSGVTVYDLTASSTSTASITSTT
jgi:hypothetical protein